MVLARPASRVRVVSAVTRRGPHQRVSAANAGGYSVPAIATPASAQAAKNSGSVGASAIPATAGTARTEPAVITGRGPIRSSRRPAGMPTSAETTRPAENAAVVVETGHPVSAAMVGASTGKA
jgi:hypothetical protein